MRVRLSYPGMVTNLLFFFTFESHKVDQMNTSGQEKVEIEVLETVEIVDLKDLVVFNDDVNTFDHVTETLIRVCRHSQEQAEQCTWIIHYKGKCTVKTGSLEELMPMKEAICEVGIDAKVL